MPARSCRVTVRDLEGVEHTVTVTAETLYEAAARGLAALRGRDWVERVADFVTVQVTEVPVEHRVELSAFRAWLERPPRSPRDVIQRGRVREILGLPVSR